MNLQKSGYWKDGKTFLETVGGRFLQGKKKPESGIPIRWDHHTKGGGNEKEQKSFWKVDRTWEGQS